MTPDALQEALGHHAMALQALTGEIALDDVACLIDCCGALIALCSQMQERIAALETQARTRGERT